MNSNIKLAKNSMKVFVLIISLTLPLAFNAHGQDDLLKQLLEEETPVPEKTIGTFMGTRLINGHSVESRDKGTLDFLISHRFGRVNWGAYEFFGLDQANIRLGLEYTLHDRLNVGIGRNSFQKVFDGFIKYKILWQETGGGMPVSMVWFSNMAINSLRRPDGDWTFQDRLAYTNQLLIGRKFNDNLSLQMSPTFIRRNTVPMEGEANNLMVLGLGGRYKITPRTSLNMEYFYRINGPDNENYRNAVAIGFDIETGGHVFQLHLTNAQAMTETMFIPETTGNFFNGDIHFGFNVSRTFQLKGKD